MNEQPYVTDDAAGDGWTLLLGDSCERLSELADDSVDLSIYSPPFGALYVYSASPRDIGNCASVGEFLTHYSYVLTEKLRITKPGRNTAVHVADIATTKATHGVMGMWDLPGRVIAAHEQAGWIYYGRWAVDRDPQAVAIRTKSHPLMFVTKNKDSTKSRPAAHDTVLLFKKPGDNQTPVVPDVTNDEWITWARPVWHGVRESNVLGVREAREGADERHLCPLSLDLIERCVRLWSNPGELVLSPFAGIGSEGYEALRRGRRFHGVELKRSYFEVARRNLAAAEAGNRAVSLF